MCKDGYSCGYWWCFFILTIIDLNNGRDLVPTLVSSAIVSIFWPLVLLGLIILLILFLVAYFSVP